MEMELRDPPKESQIAEVERRIGGQLPEDYRSWLSASDGADVDDKPMPTIGGTAILREFYSCERLSGLYGKGFGESVPQPYLPIGGTNGGAVCLRLSGDDAGAVYWANYDLANNILVDGEVSENIMMRIADNWSQFLTHW